MSDNQIIHSTDIIEDNIFRNSIDSTTAFLKALQDTEAQIKKIAEATMLERMPAIMFREWKSDSPSRARFG